MSVRLYIYVLVLDYLPPPYGSLSLNLGYLPSILIKVSGKADIGIFHMSDTIQCLRFNVHASAEMLPLEKKRVFQMLLCRVTLLLSASYYYIPFIECYFDSQFVFRDDRELRFCLSSAVSGVV